MQTIAPSFEDVTALVACFDNVQELQFGETVRVRRQNKGWVTTVRRRNGDHYYDFGSDHAGDTVYEGNLSDMAVRPYSQSIAEAVQAAENLVKQYG